MSGQSGEERGVEVSGPRARVSALGIGHRAFSAPCYGFASAPAFSAISRFRRSMFSIGFAGALAGST